MTSQPRNRLATTWLACHWGEPRGALAVFPGTDPQILTNIYWHGDEVVVAMHGEIDCCTAPALSERLTEVIEVARPRRLILDLADVPFLDCAGARAISGLQARLDTGAQVVLRSLQPIPGRVITMTGLASGCVRESVVHGGHGKVFGRPRRGHPRRRRAVTEPGLRQIG